MKTTTSDRKFKPFQIGSNTYPVFYNGRRAVILDSTEDPELGLDHSIVLWDKSLDLPMGWADKNLDGTYTGFTIYGPHEIPIAGSDLRELAADCLAQHLWIMKN